MPQLTNLFKSVVNSIFQKTAPDSKKSGAFYCFIKCGLGYCRKPILRRRHFLFRGTTRDKIFSRPLKEDFPVFYNIFSAFLRRIIRCSREMPGSREGRGRVSRTRLLILRYGI